MAELIDPTVRLRTSFLAAVSEFNEDHDYPTPCFVDDVDPTALTDTASFAAYVTRVLSDRDKGVRRADWFVPMTTLWWVEGDEMLGRLAIRHRLTSALEKAGGHIGHDVRPSARRQGHATAMRAAALPIAHSLGITQALLTCDETNTASQRVIETNGGQFIDRVGDKRRYWVPTS
ncbi:GNAT family N-acetyltransferase [Streptomyces siamensis]|uniref:GNAT family N-acetyltransferase n=1 Tax=Streptomyces siamensis TaxID=1274986 RepID=A0ABP9JFI1_9ACTN